MDSRGTPMGGGAPTWNDMNDIFDSSQFDDSMPDPAYENSAFDAFTNVDAYGESPIALSVRTPSKPGPELAQQAGPGAHVSASAESSSQDSSSDTSSRRKRKTNESESPISDPVTELGRRDGKVKQEDSKMHMADMNQVKSYDHFSQPMHNLSLEQSLSHCDSNMSQFDFASTASSPIQAGEFNTAMSLDTRMNMPAGAGAGQFIKGSPVQTIDPGMFSMNPSRDQSPATNMMFNQASPNAIFSTPSSDSPETFGNQAWNSSLQNPPWPGDFTNQLTSPGAMNFTPSPGANGGTPGASARVTAPRLGMSPLHIAPISTKSRVETQINVVMTLEKPPPGIEHLHLPLHTIAKSKLLAKDEFEKSKVLELHTMLVCTSAMHNPQFKEKALQKAASANNDEIQHRAELARQTGDEEKNDPKNVDEADRPANGGEVRICTNCIQRERKRAGRKKTKREEEQQHWERFETERVVVFNSNEYLPFKPPEMPYPHDGGMVDAEQYMPPDGSLQVSAAMRIACYCRHQSEKEGFQVIFTLKDQQGTVVAQQMSDSILITDDHKTHPQSYSTSMSNETFYPTAGYMPNGLSSGHPMSQSMVDMSQHVQPFTSSRSAGNLQALAYGAQFNPHSHVHQLPASGYASQTTLATMTPTSLSRPGSPTNAGQAGPNKKRKSGQFQSHRKVPSTLAMTPRVDTSQPPSSNMPSAVSMSSQFSPNTATFPTQVNQSYMTIPSNNGPAQYYNSGPSTPANENGPFNFSQPADMSQMRSNQAYFSHPSSAVPSRAASPVQQQSRANMAAYARQQPQQPIQTPTNSISGRSQMYPGQSMPGSTGHDGVHGTYPSISRITPREGPAAGGTEVAVFGENFVMGMSVQFGDYPNLANTTFVNANALIAIAPAGRPGPVSLTLVPPPGQTRWPKPASPTIFRYTTNSDQEEMMMAALKFLSEQHMGSVDHWQTLAQKSAASFVQSRMNPAGLHQGYPATHRMAASNMSSEEMIMKDLEAVDVGDIPEFGSNMLSFACSSGMTRVVSTSLARGASAEERDQAGFTPLMHAALRGQVKVFQMLIARGADPTVRSLNGYTAVDLAPAEVRNELLQVLERTQRRRHSRPSIQSRLSYGSVASSKASWDIASASFYESEADGSEISPSHPQSRRPSTRSLIEDDLRPVVEDSTTPSPLAAMVAWRDALAAQIHHFQETVHWNMPHFQFPPLPNLTDCRRLSSLVPGKSGPMTSPPSLASASASAQQQPARHFWQVFGSASSAAATASSASAEGGAVPPPPAYYDIFPDRKPSPQSQKGGGVDVDMQEEGVRSAVVDAVADEKCAMMFDAEDGQSACSSRSSSRLASAPNMTDGALVPSWVWMPLLVVLTSMFMHVALPCVFSEVLAARLSGVSADAMAPDTPSSPMRAPPQVVMTA